MKINLLIIFTKICLLLMLSACQKKEAKEEAKKEEITLKQATDKKFVKPPVSNKGKIFIYGLGCRWYSQSQNYGTIHFMDSSRFKFVFHKALNKRRADSEYPAYFLYDYKDEIVEGVYSIKDSGEILFQIDTYQYKDIQKHQDQGLPYQEAKPPVSRITARLDSCEGKLRLVFSPKNKIILSEKYFEWVEQNFSGRYVSYEEDVREELIVKDTDDSIQVFYQSPRYKKSISLGIKEFTKAERSLKVFFPQAPHEIYEIRFDEKYLTSQHRSDKSENTYEYQRFKKINNKYMDNPQDLSLKNSFVLNEQIKPMAKFAPDTLLPFSSNKKIRISQSSPHEFKKYFQDIAFEKLQKQQCAAFTEDYSKKYPCLQEIEKGLLNQNPNIHRENDILIFQASDNHQHFLKTNITMHTDTREFLYQGMYDSPYGQISVTLGHFWEWQNYHIFHHRSGEEIEVTGTPYFSPDGKYFVNYQNLGLYSLTGIIIQIWEIKPYGFDLIWQFQPDYIVERFAWMSNQSIVFEAYQFTQTDTEILGYGKMEIQDL